LGGLVHDTPSITPGQLWRQMEGAAEKGGYDGSYFWIREQLDRDIVPKYEPETTAARYDLAVEGPSVSICRLGSCTDVRLSDHPKVVVVDGSPLGSATLTFDGSISDHRAYCATDGAHAWMWVDTPPTEPEAVEIDGSPVRFNFAVFSPVQSEVTLVTDAMTADASHRVEVTYPANSGLSPVVAEFQVACVE